MTKCWLPILSWGHRVIKIEDNHNLFAAAPFLAAINYGGIEAFGKNCNICVSLAFRLSNVERIGAVKLC